MPTDGEVHEEIYKDMDITPSAFREMFSVISTGSSLDVSLASASQIFLRANIEMPEVVEEAVKALHDIPMNPGQVDDWLATLQGYTQAVSALYVLADEHYNMERNRLYPSHIARGEKEKKMAQLDADTSGARGVKNLLRNLFYNLTRASSSAQSILKMETVEAKMAYK